MEDEIGIHVEGSYVVCCAAVFRGGEVESGNHRLLIWVKNNATSQVAINNREWIIPD